MNCILLNLFDFINDYKCPKGMLSSHLQRLGKQVWTVFYKIRHRKIKTPTKPKKDSSGMPQKQKAGGK